MTSITKQFSKYVLQSVAGMIGISVYILADTFFISVHSGADGLTALNIILPLYGLLYALGAMIGIGSATEYTLRRAAGDKNIHFYFTHALSWDLILSLPFILLGIFIPDRVLSIMGADPAITDLGSGYIRIVLIASPAFMMHYVFTAFARNDSAPTAAMISSLGGSIFNIVFDYIFMFPLRLGLAGAALATALSPVVTMLLCYILHYARRRNTIQFRWRFPSVRQLFSCCRLGFSSFITEIASAVTTVTFNTLILRISGNTGIAAYGITANISIVAISIFNGIAQGVQPLISDRHGHGQSEQVKTLMKYGFGLSLCAELLIIAGIWLFTDPLIAVFNREANSLLSQYAHPGMRLYSLGYLTAGLNIMLIAYYSASGKAVPAFIFSLLRGITAITVCAVIMAALWGMNGIWLSFFAAETLTLITAMAFHGIKLWIPTAKK